MAKKAKPAKGTSFKPTLKSGKQKGTSINNGKADFFDQLGPLIFLCLSGLIFLQTRIKLLAIPLERDEGSFAYIGHWLMRGRELYTDMLDSKLPGLYIVYGFFTTLFGLNSIGVHMGLLIANIASAVFLYLLVKELYNQLTASLTTAFFLFFIISFNMAGFASHATQLLTPFFIWGFLMFWRGIHSQRLILFFLAGLGIGIAFAIKQQSAIFGILLAVLWWPARLIWYKKANAKLPWKEWLMLGVGGFLPLALIVSYFGLAGRLDIFFNWTVLQPMHLAGSFLQPWYTMFLNILPQVLDKFEGIWICAGLGLIFIFISGFKKGMPWFGFFFAVLGLVSVTIGAAYYLHYFVLAMPGIALLSACTLNWISQKTGKIGPALSLIIACILIGLSMRGRMDYYFHPDYAKIHFQMYGRNMFPELEKIGRELARRVPEGQRIGIMGSEPEVLVAAGRESCSRHLMVYALLSDPVLSPPLQQEYIREMQECAPEYIVWNTISGSWTGNYDKLQFFQQLMEWVEANYVPIGLAESRDDQPGVIVWDDAVNRHKSESDFKVYVLKRKGV